MKILKHYYLIELQFLGFRYHGWQKQSVHQTVQGTIEAVLLKMIPNHSPKIFGGSRTDALVSALKYVMELRIVDEPIQNIEKFIEELNFALPADVKILSIEKKDHHTNIIQLPKLKEYRYYFSYGNLKPHPFSAPFLTHISGELDLDLMIEGSKQFIGTHNFKNYCYRPDHNKNFMRSIESMSIEVNVELNANFFPEKTYFLKVTGHSFIRHQIRFIMGTLFRLGLNEITLEDLKRSLIEDLHRPIGFLAPPTGLILYSVDL